MYEQIDKFYSRELDNSFLNIKYKHYIDLGLDTNMLVYDTDTLLLTRNLLSLMIKTANESKKDFDSFFIQKEDFEHFYRVHVGSVIDSTKNQCSIFGKTIKTITEEDLQDIIKYFTNQGGFFLTDCDRLLLGVDKDYVLIGTYKK